MIRNSIFISLDSFFAGGRVGPVVLHRNWREQVVLTGGTNAPRAVHADRQSSMVVPPVPPFGTTKSLRIGCSTTGTPVPPGITAVLSWNAKACSGNPRASASAAPQIHLPKSLETLLRHIEGASTERWWRGCAADAAAQRHCSGARQMPHSDTIEVRRRVDGRCVDT
jgi:hypothetical protein